MKRRNGHVDDVVTKLQSRSIFAPAVIATIGDVTKIPVVGMNVDAVRLVQFCLWGGPPTPAVPFLPCPQREQSCLRRHEACGSR